MLTLGDSYQKGQLMRNYLFGLEYSSGWVFGRVLTFDDVNYVYDRWPTSGTTITTLAANTALGSPHELRDADTNEILWVQESNHLYQVFVGIAPPRMRLFKFYPELYLGGSLDKVTATQTPTSTSFGFVDGIMSPYDDPTTAGEVFIPKELKVQWQLFNPENFAVIPLVKFVIRNMVVQWFNPDNGGDKQIISGIMAGKIPCRLWSPGGYIPPYNTEQKLGIRGTPWQFGSGTINGSLMTDVASQYRPVGGPSLREQVGSRVQSSRILQGE